MFRLVLAGCVLSLAFSEGHHGHYGKHHGGHHGGTSAVHRHQDDHGHYDFAYDIKDGYGNVNGRKEKGTHGHVVGSYYLGEVDGRHRTVHYVADKGGFRAEVKTNEHGTKTSHPAAALYHSAYGKHIPSGHHGYHHHGHHGHHGYGKHHGHHGGGGAAGGFGGFGGF